MLKKLKFKFIINNMLLIGIVMSLIVASLTLLIYVTEENKITDVLEENTRSALSHVPSLPSNQKESDGKVYDHSFTVFLDHNFNIIANTESQLDPSDIKRAIAMSAHGEFDRGNIGHLNLSYLKTHTKDGILITFVSREHLKDRVKESVLQIISISFVSLLLFLYISTRLADIAISPVEDAWNQQKQFLADASHDLKTPLTVILANTNIITSHKEDTIESQMKWIESTAEEANRMSDLVNKMLELAKGEVAKEDIKISEINLSEIVENSILQFEVVAFERNISIESGIQPNIIVKSHASTFSKILEILFDNAIKYSDENGKINVALYQSSKKVYFSINNKGEYINHEELPHVFERFYRTNKEREVGGHGLGLSIAKKKCDLLGAKISVESNEQNGTTFTIIMKSKK